MVNNNPLTKSQKNAVAILSVGTFLEYFDLMLFVHMAVVLNDLFFPQTDPNTTKIFAAFAFCSTYLLRPIGGYIIGYIGDKIGRKNTIIITTFVMATSCVTMASTGTYAEIGITASYIIIACRMAQGFSSMGEAMGALLYLTEMIKSPNRYLTCAVVNMCGHMGSAVAVIISLLSVSVGFNWRIAFWCGAVIALVGYFARSKLRETPEFVDYKKRLNVKKEISGIDIDVLDPKFISLHEPIDKKAVFTLALNIMIIPISVYLCYIYSGIFIKEYLGLSAEISMIQNLKLSIVGSITTVIYAYYCKKYHPLLMAKWIISALIVVILFAPYLLYSEYQSLNVLLLLQLFFFSPMICSFTNISVWFRHFPIDRRFRIIATTYGIATAIGYSASSFIAIPLMNYLGHYVIWGLFAPVIIGYYYSINYAEQLERKKDSYLNYPHEGGSNISIELEEMDEEEYQLGSEYNLFNTNCAYSKEFLVKIQNINKSTNKKIDIRLLQKAMIFTKKWHHNQLRKDGKLPFYSHPFKVAEIVAEYYFKMDVIIASLLHDIVEDTDCTVDLIEKNFNSRIAQIVDRLTKIRFESEQKVKLTLKEVVHKLHKLEDFEALFIKEIDRIHNLQTINNLESSKQQKMAIETSNSLLSSVNLVCDKLNIYGKFDLENKLFDFSRNIFKKIVKKQGTLK